MAPVTIDARGKTCPKPLIMTKKALKESPEGFSVLLDSATSRDNVRRFLEDNRIEHSSSDIGDSYRIDVMSGGPRVHADLPHPDAESYCADSKDSPSSHVVSFPSDRLGDAPEDLQRTLMSAFCSTLPETLPLPDAVVFYTSGINLVLDDSPVLDSLRTLEAKGVSLLVCGTCVDYFGVKDRVSVGRISNMLDILKALTGAGHVVTM